MPSGDDRDMVSSERVQQYLLYYGALIVLVFGSLWLIEFALGELDFWPNVVVLFVLVFIFDRFLGNLGWAPHR